MTKTWQRHFVFILSLWCSLGLSCPASAGAWPMPPGKGQIISTTVYNNAGRAYDDMWNLTRDVNFSKLDSQFYMEHGLTPKITLVGTTAFQDVDFTSRTGREKVTGFGTSSIGARYQMASIGRTVISAQAAFILAGAGENIADADLGRGGNGVELRGLVGHSFKIGSRPAFIDIQSAWIYRPGASPDTFKDDVTLGLDVHPKYQILAQGFYSRTNSQRLGNDLILPNASIKLQASMVHKRSEKTSYQFGVFRTAAGRNIVKESGIFAGYWRRY